MFSVKAKLLRPKHKGRPSEKTSSKNGRRFPVRLSSGWHLGGSGTGRRKPQISIQLWLTALFLLVTAFAGITAYFIVTPILGNTLEQSAKAGFEQVGEQFEVKLQKDTRLTEQEIGAFATNRGVQWGIVRLDGEVLRGDLGDYNTNAVKDALADEYPETELKQIESGEREGQTLATYAAPIQVAGETNTAIVFTRYYIDTDIENADAAMRNITNMALFAGVLALLIAGFSGYVVANLISRRLNRLDVAAKRLASGNFDERITTSIEDEVGSLGETFNAMASSLKGAFRQVEQEKARGQAILDGMTDAVVGVDNDLNATFLNPRAREVLENSDPAFHDRLQEILAKSRFSSSPVAEPEAEAGDRIIEIRAAPLVDGALAILRDVTEERQIERAKAEFIANASHELKTPLFALSGYLEMLEDEEDEEVRDAFLKDMQAQTDRLKNLARTLLDLSRLDANAVTFRLEEVDLEDLLHEIRRDFAYTGREINIHAEKGVPPVKTDPIQLRRMLAILLDNALKYSGGPEGVDPVELDLHHENGHALVSVTDRGCGIPEAEIPYIFDRFYRAQGSSRADGTGLGLALAGEISQRLGGDIYVESKRNAGSTFSAVLPLAENTPNDQPEE